MIAPKPADEPTFEPIDVTDAASAFFRPGGALSREWEDADGGYEVRPQQVEMACAVAEAIGRGGHLAVEAGTGVGKSFAYLVPALLAAFERNEQVIISTYTIGLQEQLMRKDIPLLRRHLGQDFKAVMAKGRGNYLCLRRLARADRMGGDLFRTTQQMDLDRIRVWSTNTTDGTLQDLTEQPPHDVWSAVNVEHGNCMWQRCPEYGRCFLMKARQAMKDARLVVVNHHLFFSDLALKAMGGSLLPAAPVCVLDEAHLMEGVASDHLGLRLSQYSFEHWLRRLYVPESGKGLLAALGHGEASNQVVRVREELDRFFEEVRKVTDLSPRKSQQVIRAPLVIETSTLELMRMLNQMLREIHEELEDLDARAELAAARRRGAEHVVSLEAFLRQSMQDQVYWVALEGGRRKQVVLHSAPIEVGPALSETLFAPIRTAVMTSATMAVAGTLDYFKQRVGALDAESVCLGSPFDYGRQMKVVLPQTMPDPNTPEFIEASARAICRLVDLSAGRAFILCTSDSYMRQVVKLVRPHMEARGFPLIVQGEGLPRNLMVEKFKSLPGSVLFGLDSFWMGVDVRGEALSHVIITRLPFSVPDEPVVAARMERIKERGGDPFKEYALPEALLKFRQGVGRLIRSATDTGIVSVLDPRMTSKWYGRMFRAALPECPVEIVEGLDSQLTS